MQKIGDYYGSCMDEQTVNKKGVQPIQAELDSINKVSNKDQLIEAVAHLQTLGMSPLFRYGSQPDLHNATMMIAAVLQGGLGLPDRDLYLNGDPKSQETRQKYQEHLNKIFGLIGDD